MRPEKSDKKETPRIRLAVPVPATLVTKNLQIRLVASHATKKFQDNQDEYQRRNPI